MLDERTSAVPVQFPDWSGGLRKRRVGEAQTPIDQVMGADLAATDLKTRHNPQGFGQRGMD